MNVDHLSDVQLALRPHRITGPVMAAFVDAAAIQPQAAILYRPASPPAETEFRQMIATGALKAYGDRYWLDLRAHYAVRRTSEVRWMIGLVIGALVLALLAVQFYLGGPQTR